ncbi:MAG TPA: OmpH family outer membrane protein [Alphaproteobacteria bacterium]|jgi:Skp family chaperone for outer membrane proteins|nr:OmpH family outer membrane protein [Alphaproteobacteria bacterium]
MRYPMSVLGLAFAGAIAVVPAALAQTPAAAPAVTPGVLAPPTVAVVDMQKVLLESAAGRSIQSQLEGERRKIRDQVAKLDDELKATENEIKRQRSVMAPDAVNEQVQGFQRKQADAQRVVQERQEAFTKGQNDAVNVVGDNMRDIVQQLAAERHIGLIVRKEVVLSMADKNMDITDDVIQRLNTKLPTVTVTIPAPGTMAAQPAAPAATAPAAKSAPAPKASKK